MYVGSTHTTNTISCVMCVSHACGRPSVVQSTVHTSDGMCRPRYCRTSRNLCRSQGVHLGTTTRQRPAHREPNTSHRKCISNTHITCAHITHRLCIPHAHTTARPLSTAHRQSLPMTKSRTAASPAPARLSSMFTPPSVSLH